MARKTLNVTIIDEGRDKGKQFFITEMSGPAAEDWAFRVFLALARSGVDVPENFSQAGMAGLASLSLQAIGGMKYHEAKPLLDEMLSCVKILPDPSRPEVTRGLVNDDTEEVKTLFKLRQYVFELHTGFSLAAVISPSTPPSA